jgi:hypothetical protein
MLLMRCFSKEYVIYRNQCLVLKMFLLDQIFEHTCSYQIMHKIITVSLANLFPKIGGLVQIESDHHFCLCRLMKFV